MNMRFWLEALAEPNRMAAQVLTTRPMNVSTLGLMRESASQRTMVSSRTPQARPKALVQLRLGVFFEGELLSDADLSAELRSGSSRLRLVMSPTKRPPFPNRPRRGWWTDSEFRARACRWE